MNNMNNNSAKKSSNGRVNLKDGPNIGNLFAMYDKIPANQCVSYREPTLGQWDETILSRMEYAQEFMKNQTNNMSLVHKIVNL